MQVKFYPIKAAGIFIALWLGTVAFGFGGFMLGLLAVALVEVELR